MKKFLKYIVFICILSISFNCKAEENGFVIPQTKDIRPEKIVQELQNTAPLAQQAEIWLRRYEYFNRNYPGDAIDNDFIDEIEAAYPYLTRQEMYDKEDSIRFTIKAYRSLTAWYEKIKEKILAPEPPPLVVDEEDYDTPYTADYIESENLIIIPDFKKVLGYGTDRREFEAMELRARRKALKEKRIPQSADQLRNLFGLLEFKKLFFYGIVYDDPFTGKKGIGDWNEKEQAKVRLLSAKPSVGADEVRAAVHVRLKPGYAIVWSPQKKLEPPVFDFSASENVASADVLLPVPVRFLDKTKDNILTYNGDFAIPVALKSADAERPVLLKANMRFTVCKGDVCKPVDFLSELKLEAGKSSIGSAVESFINRAFGMLPQPADDNFVLEKAVVDKPLDENEGESLRLVFRTGKTPENLFVSVEGDGAEVFLRPRVTIDEDVITARFDTPAGTKGLAGKSFSLTAALNDRLAIRHDFTAREASVFDVSGKRLSLGLVFMAMLGGLILNFMPCVFPVLSLKFVSLVKFGGLTREKVRQGFAFTVAGIFAAFAFLTVVLLLLKAGGFAIGWGMQFQNPYFLVAMMFVMILFAAQILGFISIKAPTFSEKLFNRRSKQDNFLHFLTGLFLVLVSTPCTAPYLGTAIGFALAGSYWDIAVILPAVGFGLALPYIFLAVYPDGGLYMPKPGKWMVRLERFMILMLFLTVVWMASVLSAQAGLAVSLKIIGCLLIFLALLWFRKILLDNIELQKAGADVKSLAGDVAKSLVFTLSAVLLISSFVMAKNGFLQNRQENAEYKELQINLSEIENELKAGNAVVVKVGADWCLTCSYNNITVFNNPVVEDVLRANKVKIVEVDWTNYDAEILAFMKRYGRSGLPFYVLFSRKYPDGIVLPEVLDESTFSRILKNFIN